MIYVCLVSGRTSPLVPPAFCLSQHCLADTAVQRSTSHSSSLSLPEWLPKTSLCRRSSRLGCLACRTWDAHGAACCLSQLLMVCCQLHRFCLQLLRHWLTVYRQQELEQDQSGGAASTNCFVHLPHAEPTSCILIGLIIASETFEPTQSLVCSECAAAPDQPTCVLGGDT